MYFLVIVFLCIQSYKSKKRLMLDLVVTKSEPGGQTIRKSLLDRSKKNILNPFKCTSVQYLLKPTHLNNL